jgi:hypothetical protein
MTHYLGAPPGSKGGVVTFDVPIQKTGIIPQPFAGQLRSIGQTVAGKSQDKPAPSSRWPVEKAWHWYKQQPWVCGFNYIPATAINYTEMWQKETFDPKTIDEELALAEQVRFNSLRCVLQYLVWEHDAEGFKQRLDQFLSICHKHGIRVIFCLFDDCVFGPKHDPYLGKQADVVPGWYAHDWSPSPGWSRVKDPRTWPKLQQYVQDVITRYKDDPRVLMWDLYNEPTNEIGDVTLPLVAKIVDCAQQVNPSQPLTIGVWNENKLPNDVAIHRCDIITFHRYSNAAQLEAFISSLEKHGRPLICTEWLKRDWGSVADQLPVFARHHVGCLHWGLVNGKTQTQYPWGSKPGAPEPRAWQHDIFRKDRTPYDPHEIEAFKQAITNSQREAPQVRNGAAPVSPTPSSKTILLFSYFVDNGEDGLHLALSDDGFRWQALNGGRSFLKPQAGKSRLMRDPCLFRAPDGTFHMVWTNGWNDRTIGYASSKDLLHWSEQRAIPVMAHEPKAMNCWAPEIVYDETKQQCLIFWSTTIPGRFPLTDDTGDDQYNHRIYATTTRDFKTFTPTRLFFDGGFNVIDATMLHAEGKYYLIVKDETLKPVKKNLRIAVGASPEGPFGEISAPITPSWVEGPSASRIGEDYIVFFDCYTKGCYGAVRSRNLKDWEDISSRISFPKGARHGTVLRVPQSVVDKLSEAR